jgi:hypothetical protein
MYRMKTIAFVTLAAGFALAGCAAAAPATEAPAAPAASGLPTLACAPNCEYSDLVVGFLQTGSEGGWRAANTASFKETAEQLGLNLKFYDSQNDLANQVAGFRQFIQDPEVNVIVLAALETTGWEDVLQEAQDAGKVVVLEDRRIDAPEDLYSTYIGSEGWPPRVATVILLGYWVMAVVGRALSSRAQAWLGKPGLVLAAALLAAAGCLALLAGAGSLAVLAVSAWVTSLAMSAVFPTTLAIAGDRYRRYAGSVFGFLFTIANFGGMLFPWALGRVSQAGGVRLGMIVPLVGTLAVAGLAVVVKRADGRLSLGN